MNDFSEIKDLIFRILPGLLIAILIPLAANAKDNKDCLVTYEKSRSFNNALEAFSYGNKNAAESYFKEEIRQHPGNGIAYFYLAMLAWDKNDGMKAVNYLEDAKRHLGGKANKKYKAMCLSFWGDMWMEAGYPDEAYRYYFDAIKLDHSKPEYLEYISEASYAAGFSSDIKTFAGRLIKKFPDYPYGYFSMGRYLMKYKDDARGALDYFEKALEKDSCHYRSKGLKSIILMDAGKWDEAFDMLFGALEGGDSNALNHATNLNAEGIAELERYVESHPEENKSKWQYPFALGQTYMRNGMFDKAVQKITEVLALEPTEGEYESLAECHLMTGHLNRAMEAINMAIAFDPDYSSFTQIKARIFLLSGEPEKAKKVLADFLDRKPDNIFIRFSRAVVNASTGNTADAMSDIDTLVAKRPDDSLILYDKGILHLMNGQDAEASVCFKKVVKKIKDNDKHSMAIGSMAYARLGDAEKANRIIGTLSARYPREGMVHYFVARAFAILGNDNEALRHLELSHANDYEKMPVSLVDYDFRDLRKNKAFIDLIDKLMPGLKESGRISDSLLWQ